MKKRLFFIIIMLSVITATLTSILSMMIYYNFYTDDAKDQIKTISRLTSANPDDWNDYSSIHVSVNNILRSVNYKIRITLIEESGVVLYDNLADKPLENHRDRKEVVEAFNRGSGEDIRHSDTMDIDTYYYAVKLDDNTVLRLSRELSNIRVMFTDIVPMLISLFVLIIIIDFFAASAIIKKFIKPIKQMTSSLDEIMEENDNINIEFYDEFEPLAIKLKEQKIKINEYINAIKYERDTISIITENMREGFILLNNNKNILSINTSGKSMIGNVSFNLNEHKNILELTRNPEILNNIDIAIKENKHLVYDTDTDRHYYRFYLSPVTDSSDNSVAGLLILIEDVTMQKNSEQMRREFTANVSHELKTPLTTMIGFAEMIKEGLITDLESIKKYCGMINKEGLRLISLIEDIMRLSKIEEGVEIQNNSIFNLKDMSFEVCKLLKSKADERNIKLILNADNISIKANKNYINELLYNLIDNGIKYNKNEGSVFVRIFKNDGMINIAVKDTGIGIPEEHHDRIFERFYRVDKSRSKETGGTGLGLSIVKHIAEIYEGTLELNSNENIGTEIIVKFPGIYLA